MLAVISPAKKLDMVAVEGKVQTQPEFVAQSQDLVEIARSLDVAGLRKLMKISEKLAELNVKRFLDFSETPGPNATKQAMYMFAGDTYTGLDARTLDDDAVAYAQRHLRILSGLYGILRPLDGIQPYRLEMGSKLASPKGKNLYEFWGPTLSNALNADAEKAGTDMVLNCASTEYFSAVDRSALVPQIITPVFLELRNGTSKVISFHAKKARGAIARFVMENRVTSTKELEAFAVGGYAIDKDQSTADTLVFSRES